MEEILVEQKFPTYLEKYDCIFKKLIKYELPFKENLSSTLERVCKDPEYISFYCEFSCNDKRTITDYYKCGFVLLKENGKDSIIESLVEDNYENNKKFFQDIKIGDIPKLGNSTPSSHDIYCKTYIFTAGKGYMS